MSDTVIKVENLYKEYRLGTVNHGTLRHDLASWWAKMRGKEDPNSLITASTHPLTPSLSPAGQRGGIKKDEEELKSHFLAVNDVSFEVKQGEALGIIGRNGAGKSTLLKILSRITTPTSGIVKIKGRMASLLEVGTGFHPELTGRENVYMNGAILGMRRWEIGRKMEEIVAFSGLEKFIDTPVKRYSSGMYVRLAFAVAAHLNSEILVLDEVLAVGDTEFQKKCLGKMDDVARKQGRTVLFVSHNMQAVNNLCTKCILLDKGMKTYEGATETALQEYNKALRNSRLKINKGEYNTNRRGSGTLSFTNIEILDINNEKRNSFNIGETVRFKMDYATHCEIKGLHVGVNLRLSRFDMSLTDATYEVKHGILHENEQGSVLVEFDLSSIRAGEYNLYFWLGDTAALTQGKPTNYDVVDDMTESLIVKAKDEEKKKWTGCFSLLTNIKIL